MTEEYEKTKQWHDVLHECNFNIATDKFIVYVMFYINNCYIVEEVIKSRRLMFGWSQAKLAEGICSVKTLSRLENGKAKTTRYNLKQLLEKLNLPTGLYNDNVKFVDLETFRAYTQIDYDAAQGNYKKAKIHLNQTKNKLDMEDKATKQYVLHLEAVVDYNLESGDKEHQLEVLKEILEITLNIDDVFSVKEQSFTKVEGNIICNIIYSLEHLQRYDEMHKYKKVLERYFSPEKMMHNHLYVFATYSISKLYSNTGQFSVSNKINQDLIEKSLATYKFSLLGSVIFCIAWNLDQMGHDEDEVRKLIKIAYTLADIVKDEELKRTIRQERLYK
ncbi:MAG: hypothetical protein ATN35_07350 [Epulopiscium sp. Nele67-Bin004]|nr:MAG: hypothetical protein ATN35_07350 [Epulopiscium sp. Nele67-Bin004]